ncbi:hypothetical protein GSI_11326 [Ganoderma sinense ZZ0214-1]|uniref:Uncharacterized protein n=1 Tax=Ganoderma sinense ZZ0214-1 TaxID=1077348 RepID=A0A2G8RVP6_9APHY|nr:hypothetical protein GSI_11326 [Ganoderma sinense ZZ0214-1]
MVDRRPLGQALRAQHARREIMVHSKPAQTVYKRRTRKARMRWSFKAYLDDSFFGLDIQFHYILYSPTSADAPASHASCTSLAVRRLYRWWDIKACRYRWQTNPFDLPYRYEWNAQPKSAEDGVSGGRDHVAEVEVEAAKQQVGKGAAEGIEEFSDDDDERRELVRRECWAPVAACSGRRAVVRRD